MSNFKIGDKVIVVEGKQDYCHNTSRYAVVVGDANRRDYGLRFEGCDCGKKKVKSGQPCCEIFSECFVKIDTRQSKEYQNKAQSLKDWFDGDA